MGQTFSNMMKQAIFIPKSHFTVDDIPDLSGKVMIVTGGNAGIGKETVKALLEKNAKVYLAARSKEKAAKAIADLKEATGREAIFLELDLANLTSVKRAAETFRSLETRLDVLFNNGGVMGPPISQITADGYDLQFGTNVLGHFYFTKLLLPTLIETAKVSPDGKSRVINTSSSGHMMVNGLDFDTFRNDGIGAKKRAKMGSTDLYAQSKFGNVVFSNELARRYGDQGIVSIALNPGNIQSELQRHWPVFVKRLTYATILFPTPMGAITQLYAGTSPETVNMNGKYLIPWAREGPVRGETRDVALGEKLWTWLEDQVKDVQ